MAGETTSLAATAWADSKVFQVLKGVALQVAEATATYSNTNQLETNDVMEVCYLPSGLKVYGIAVTATDMDTNVSPALVQKITIGSTDVLTGITNGQSGATSYLPLPTPYTTSAIELVKITTTTAAATGATGSVKLRFYYTAP